MEIEVAVTYPVKMIASNNSEITIESLEDLEQNFKNGNLKFSSLVSTADGQWMSFGKTEYAGVIIETYPRHRIGSDGEGWLANFLWAYFSPYGRITRRTYWKYSIIGAVISLILATVLATPPWIRISQQLDDIGDEDSVFALFGLIWGGVLIGLTFFPSLFLVRKRLNDRNRPDYLTALFFVPVLNLWPAFEAGFQKGEEGPNQHGPAPV